MARNLPTSRDMVTAMTSIPNPPESCPAAYTAEDMIARLAFARNEIERRIAECQEQLRQHYLRQDQLEEERFTLVNDAEKAMQNEMISVLQKRIRSLDSRINTCRHDLQLLRHYGSIAQTNPGGNTGDLWRLLKEYGAGLDTNLPHRDNLPGLEALPDFIRPGARSGIAHLTKTTQRESLFFRGKIAFKMIALTALLFMGVQAIESGSGLDAAGGARFEKPGAGGLSRISERLSPGSAFEVSGPAKHLIRVFGSTTGVDLHATVHHTEQALKGTEILK